jgi:glycosyltransferase XagB
MEKAYTFPRKSLAAGVGCWCLGGPSVALADVRGAAVRRSKVEEWPERRRPEAFVPHARARPLPTARRSVFPEIDCVRSLLPRRVIAAAEERARSIGVGAERVLICADAMTEEAYLTALAASVGTSYEPLDRISRVDCPLDDHQLIQAAAAGLLPLREGDALVWVIAPRCLTARRLADPRQSRPQWLRSFRLTSSDRLWSFVARYTQDALGRRAVDELSRLNPELSNAPRPPGARHVATMVFVALAGAILAVVPAATIDAFATLLCSLFLAAAAMRLFSVAFAGRGSELPFRIGDDELPIYTIICPLYREANVVSNLVAAIRALDYPAEKLDVKFVLEADDNDTRRALARLDLGPPFAIITAPPFGPRTKPKALNVALPFAQGSFTAIYDAEDVPERDQLRRVLDAFMAADEQLACVQASLTIDNPADSWLARMFTAGYAGQFDAFLPGLSALHLPFPLGGSSNHFRTAALRQVGGWDPYNVTEDADLGIRLYRLGYRSAALSSATYEEAPVRFKPWLKQRTRWYKGWIQTWLVHMRNPGRLVRELTPAGAIAFQLFLACNVLAALIHPVFLIGLCCSLFAMSPLQAIGAMAAAPVFTAAFLAGYVSTIALDIIGLRRRGLLAHAWALVLTPLYWLLLSLAAWRALFHLLYDPQRWEKTEHGLARSSRLSRLAQEGAPA